jgi:hypothetical protein
MKSRIFSMCDEFICILIQSPSTLEKWSVKRLRTSLWTWNSLSSHLMVRSVCLPDAYNWLRPAVMYMAWSDQITVDEGDVIMVAGAKVEIEMDIANGMQEKEKEMLVLALGTWEEWFCYVRKRANKFNSPQTTTNEQYLKDNSSTSG